MLGKRIRVLHSLAAIAHGGVERRRLTLARHLDPARYEQRIMVRGVKGGLVDAFAELNVPVISVGGDALFDARAVWSAVTLARDFRPHIVHGAVFEGVALAVIAGHASGARIVIEETSYATNRSWLGHRLFGAFAALADNCVAVSPAVVDYLTRVTRVRPQKIRLIANGVAKPTLPAAAERRQMRSMLAIPVDALVIGSIGRMVDDTKRFGDLIRALPRLLAETRHRCRLLLVGDGRMRTELERLAHALGVRDYVVFAGERDDVGAMYGVMDVFALVSERESFGLVLVEAMACRLPVVATAVGGINDVVADEETGLLVPVGDVDRIAAALSRMLRDEQLRGAMGRAGEARASAEFSAERYARDVDALYREILSSDHDGRAASTGDMRAHGVGAATETSPSEELDGSRVSS